MRKLLVLALLLAPLAKADTILSDSTIAFTPIGDPFSPDWGRVAVIYNNPDFNESAFLVDHTSPFTVSNNRLTFLPGVYDHLGFETLTISAVGQQVNFLFEEFSFPFPGNPGQITSFDWRLASTVVPDVINNGIDGDRFYVNDVDVQFNVRPFATPEPSTFVLLGGAFLLIGGGLIISGRREHHD